MILKQVIKKITQNLNVRCEFCRMAINRKLAHFETVKLLAFVYPRNTAFCNETCCEKYKDYERPVPKRASLCSSCPVHPDSY